MSEEDAIERARSFIPILRERSLDAEQARELPRSTYEEFRDAGFYRLAQPEPYGGVGLDVDAVNDVCFELARGDPSAAWVCGFYGIHNHMIGAYSKKAQEEYWAENFDQNMATGSAVVRCEFQDRPDGLMVSGEWDFCSGISHAEWLQIYRNRADKADQMLIPRTQFEVVDNWTTAGARATGSNRVRVDGVFVPRHRILDVALPATGRSPGRELYGTRYYKLPAFTFEGMIISAVIMGGAQGIIDVFQETAPRRREVATNQMFIDRPTNQVRLAESSAEVDAAREIMAADTRRLKKWADEDYEPTMLERARIRRNAAFCVKLALSAAYRLFEISGAHAIYDKSPIQRYYRDVSTMSHALAAPWDPPAENYCRIAWGLPPISPLT